MIMKIFKSICLVFVLTGFSSATEKDIKLEYKFSVGDQYALIQNNKATITQDLMGMEQIVENAMAGALLLKVVSLTPTGAKLEIQYTALTMILKLPAGLPSVTLDSGGDPEQAENKIIKSMMNRPFTMTLTKQGIVENIEGEENLWAGLSDLEIDKEQISRIKRQLEQSLGENAIRSSFEMALANYSEKKLKVGDPWKNKTGVAIDFPMQAENTWKILSVVKETANLSADGIVSTTDKEKINDLPGGLKSKLDLNGTHKITSVVNLKTGWPSETKINSQIKGFMNLLAGGVIPADMQIPIEILTQSTFVFVKK
jgi:hypothetical protein